MQLIIFFLILCFVWPLFQPLLPSQNLVYPMLLMLPVLFCILITYSIYKLIKLYKIKADNKRLKAGWRSILNYFLFFPAFTYAVISFRFSVPININSFDTGYGFDTGYKLAEQCGPIIGHIGWFFIFSYLFTYFIPWLISLFRNKEISANLLGFFITLFWLPVSIGTTIMIYHTHHNSKAVSHHLKTISTDKDRALNFNLALYKNHGFDIIDLNDESSISNFFEKEILSLSLKEAKELKTAFTEKLEKLTAFHHWWTTQYATLSVFNEPDFDKLIIEHVLKSDGSPEISETGQRDFIAGTKKRSEETIQKTLKILDEHNVTSPCEFKIHICKRAIEILNLCIVSYKTDNNQELLQLEKEIDRNISIINNYIEKATELQSKILELEKIGLKQAN